MPTTYTHYRFGEDVFRKLPKILQDTIGPYRQLYDIGQHGPDLFFYYRAYHKNRVSQIGFDMHNQPGILFFRHAAALLKPHFAKYSLSAKHVPAHLTQADRAKLAYLCGFYCHFALDSTCHPYVEQMARKTGISHSEIEAELDRYFMMRDGLNPLTHRATNHIKAHRLYGRIIASFFPTINCLQARTSIWYMRRCCNLLVVPGRPQRLLTYLFFKLVRAPQAIPDMIIRYRINPDTIPLTNHLEELYDQAVLTAVELILNFLDHVEHEAPLDQRLLHTFGEF